MNGSSGKVVASVYIAGGRLEMGSRIEKLLEGFNPSGP